MGVTIDMDIEMDQYNRIDLVGGNNQENQGSFRRWIRWCVCAKPMLWFIVAALGVFNCRNYSLAGLEHDQVKRLEDQVKGTLELVDYYRQRMEYFKNQEKKCHTDDVKHLQECVKLASVLGEQYAKVTEQYTTCSYQLGMCKNQSESTAYSSTPQSNTTLRN